MKRSFSFTTGSTTVLVVAGTALIAATYGLVRLAYGLYLPEMRATLEFGDVEAGIVAAGASVLYCLGAIAAFLTGSRAPRALTLAAGTTAGAGAIGMSMAEFFPLFAAAAVLGSAGAGLASPALVEILDRAVTGPTRACAQTIVNAGTGPGLVAAGILALTLLPDWRAAWAVSAAVTLVAAISVAILARGPGDRPAASRIAPPRGWIAAHRRVIVAAAVMGAGSAAMWNYGRTLLVSAGAAEATTVLAWVALGVGGSAAILTARGMTSLHPRTAWALATSAAGIGTAALVTAPTSAVAALASCAIFGWGYTAATGALIGWTGDIDPARAATGTALLFIVLILGQAVGAAAVGALIDAVGGVGAFLAATAGLAGAAAVALVTKTGSRAPAPRICDE